MSEQPLPQHKPLTRAKVRIGRQGSKCVCTVNNLCRHPISRFLIGSAEHDVFGDGYSIKTGDPITFHDSSVIEFMP